MAPSSRGMCANLEVPQYLWISRDTLPGCSFQGSSAECATRYLAQSPVLKLRLTCIARSSLQDDATKERSRHRTAADPYYIPCSARHHYRPATEAAMYCTVLPPALGTIDQCFGGVTDQVTAAVKSEGIVLRTSGCQGATLCMLHPCSTLTRRQGIAGAPRLSAQRQSKCVRLRHQSAAWMRLQRSQRAGKARAAPPAGGELVWHFPSATL
jgi:hypothetical protein